MAMHTCGENREQGFTLLEMAVVMVILGVLLGGLITPLMTQRDTANERATNSLLDEIQTALIGFAIVNGRLPCPATATSSGAEVIVAGGDCSLDHGFVPARTLGLNGRFDSNNQLLDSWNNPIKYSLSDANGSHQYSSVISLPILASTLQICRDVTCAASDIIADNLMAVIISRGKDGHIVPTSPSQLLNYKPENNSNNNFVVTSISDASNNEFDDIVRWISPTHIALPLVRAGKITAP